MKCAAEMAVN